MPFPTRRFCNTRRRGNLPFYYSSLSNLVKLHFLKKKHCRGVVKHHLIDSKGRTQEVNFIGEGDMYRFIAHSKLESAERFEIWVFDEVLPTLRKTGSYEIPKYKSQSGRLPMSSVPLMVLEYHIFM